ncbi:ligase-associated DNA damage response endonuclease PdeM, partial [Tepidimonas sp.]|uniref:ligase-associated DNA damage response endonuclease PdeM n=1 Tax=Tepidimonas sp. TaxID=2002775 RepID=UPI002FDFBA31
MTDESPLRGALPVQVPAWGDTGVLWLLAQRAVWWPAGSTLFVADVHLGKAAAFRAAGVPVPSGTTRDNLQRLGALLQASGARRLVVLGDWLHARAARTPAVLQALRDWRAAHAALQCVLVRGNHDTHAGDPPPELAMEVVDEPWPLGPWVCHHAPPPASAAAPAPGELRSASRWWADTDPHPLPPPAPPMALCGHTHPVAVVRGGARERLRLPCYVLTPSALWLPAFGAFTGGRAVAWQSEQQRCVLAEGAVWPVDVRWPKPWSQVRATASMQPAADEEVPTREGSCQA